MIKIVGSDAFLSLNISIHTQIKNVVLIENIQGPEKSTIFIYIFFNYLYGCSLLILKMFNFLKSTFSFI